MNEELIKAKRKIIAKIKKYIGAKYFVTFINDKSRKINDFFLKQKRDVLEIFKKYKECVENECESKVKYLRTDDVGDSAVQNLMLRAQNVC